MSDDASGQGVSPPGTAPSSLPGSLSEHVLEACKEVWDRFLCRDSGNLRIHHVHAILGLPSVMWQLGMSEQPSLTLARAAMQTCAVHSTPGYITLGQYHDAVLYLLGQLDKQRQRCQMYHAWAMRLLMALAVVGLMAVLAPYRLAAYVLLPALVLGPAVGIAVLLEMDEVAKLRMQWKRPCKAGQPPANVEMVGTAPLAVRRMLPQLSKGTDQQHQELATADEVHGLLSQPVDDLRDSDVAKVYTTLIGDELFCMVAESDDDNNIDPALPAPEPEAPASPVSPTRSLGTSASVPVPPTQVENPLKHIKSVNSMPRQKWSTEIVVPHTFQSNRSSCASQGGHGMPSNRTSTGSTGAYRPSPLGGSGHLGAISSASPSGQLPTATSCPPWLTPLPTSITTTTRTTDEGAVNSPPTPTSPDHPGSTGKSTPLRHSPSLGGNQTTSGTASPSRFAAFSGISRLGSTLSLGSGRPAAHKAADSHRLSRKAQKAAEKARHIAAEEAQKQLGWRRKGDPIGDLNSGLCLQKPGNPGLFFLENLPPPEARVSAVASSSDEEDLDYHVDLNNPACVEALEAINGPTMISPNNGPAAGATSGPSAQVGRMGSILTTQQSVGVGSPTKAAAEAVGKNRPSVERLANRLTQRLAKLVSKLHKGGGRSGENSLDRPTTSSTGGRDTPSERATPVAPPTGLASVTSWDKIRASASKVKGALTGVQGVQGAKTDRGGGVPGGAAAGGARSNSWDRGTAFACGAAGTSSSLVGGSGGWASSGDSTAAAGTTSGPGAKPYKRIGTTVVSSLEETPETVTLNTSPSILSTMAGLAGNDGASTVAGTSARLTPDGVTPSLGWPWGEPSNSMDAPVVLGEGPSPFSTAQPSSPQAPPSKQASTGFRFSFGHWGQASSKPGHSEAGDGTGGGTDGGAESVRGSVGRANTLGSMAEEEDSSVGKPNHGKLVTKIEKAFKKMSGKASKKAKPAS